MSWFSKKMRRKYWVHPYFNKSGKFGDFVVAREFNWDSERFR
jgi:hypothetical protein